jgi:hypothetical protein
MEISPGKSSRVVAEALSGDGRRATGDGGRTPGYEGRKQMNVSVPL